MNLDLALILFMLAAAIVMFVVAFRLMHDLGFTPDRVVAAAHASLERVGVITGDKTGS